MTVQVQFPFLFLPASHKHRSDGHHMVKQCETDCGQRQEGSAHQALCAYSTAMPGYHPLSTKTMLTPILNRPSASPKGFTQLSPFPGTFLLKTPSRLILREVTVGSKDQ